MPTFHLKKDIMTGHKKKEIVNMAQENLHMFKRLKEKTSYYDFGKYDKEYDQAQYYKRSHCALLPSIDFNKAKRTISLGSKSKIIHRSYFNINNSTSFNIINTSNSYNINKATLNTNNISKEQNLFNNNLHKKKLDEFKYEDFADFKNKTKIEKDNNNTKEERKNVNDDKNKDKKINDIKEMNKSNKNNNKQEKKEELNKEKNDDIKKKENIKEIKNDDKENEENKLEKTHRNEDNKNQIENKEQNEDKKSIKI